MGRFTDGIRRIFGRRRPVTPEEAEVLSNWVNEGGTFHPEGPPPVVEGGPPSADPPAAGPPER
jgi:hypothetical protein